MRNGSELIAASLLAGRVAHVFHAGGGEAEHLLRVLGKPGIGIDAIRCAHDARASCMAAACGRLTGRPGICLTRDGLAVASGVREASRSGAPMLVLSCDPSPALGGRHAGGGADLLAVCRGIAKWAAPIPSADLIPEYVNRAFRVALSGRSGPVALSLPCEMLSGGGQAPLPQPAKPAAAGISDAALEGMRHMLSRAKRPLLLLGGSWTPAASEGIAEFARANNLPVVSAFGNPDCIDNRLDNYVGHAGPGMAPFCARLFAECDFLAVVGAPLDEVATCGYELIEPPWPHCKLVHVHPGMDELGKAYSADLAINARVSDFAARARRLPPVDHGAWDEWTLLAEADAAANAVPLRGDELSLAGIVSWLSGALPDDAVIACEDRAQAELVCRHFRFKQPGTALISAATTPGYGFAAALAGALTFPGRAVVALAGSDPLCAAAEISYIGRRGGKLVVVAESAGDGAGADLSGIASSHAVQEYAASDEAAFRSAFSEALSSDHAVSLVEVALPQDRSFA